MRYRGYVDIRGGRHLHTAGPVHRGGVWESVLVVMVVPRRQGGECLPHKIAINRSRISGSHMPPPLTHQHPPPSHRHVCVSTYSLIASAHQANSWRFLHNLSNCTSFITLKVLPMHAWIHHVCVSMCVRACLSVFIPVYAQVVIHSYIDTISLCIPSHFL